MELLTSNTSLMMERAVDFLWGKQAAILENLSNVETPGYKAKYVTFEESLKEALQKATGRARPKAEAREALERATYSVHVADEATRMDENGVNATEQGVELARAALQMQFVFNAITSDMAALRTAIRGQ